MYKILIINFNAAAPVNIQWGFKEIGCQVLTYTAGKKDRDYTEFGNTITNMVASFKPQAILSYGYWISTVNIAAFLDAVDKLGILHAFWAIDDPELFEEVSYPIARKADMVFTTDINCIQKYQEKGVDAYFLIYGCHPPVHKKIEAVEEFKHDIVLLAHNYNVKWDPDYFSYRFNGIKNIVRPIVENDYDINVWGLWWDSEDRIYNLPAKNYGSVLESGNEARVYSSSKIVLGLQTVGSSETMLSIRTLEVLSCGAFHLSQYSRALEYYFKKGVHLEWSQSPAETIELVNFYLKNEDARERVALQGQKEVHEKHTMAIRAREALKVLKKYS